MTLKKDLTGKRFGRLVVLHEVPKKPGDRRVRWMCKCDCGNTCETTGDCLRGGKISCGCFLSERKAVIEALCKVSKEERECYKKYKCPFPAYSCRKNIMGMCCVKCDDYNTCELACKNKPDKCGLYKKA